MGRFYKNTPARFVDDIMYELDSGAMIKASGIVNKNITDVYDKIDEAVVSTEQLEQDNEEMRGYVAGINSDINGVTNAMSDSVLNYKSQGPVVRGITRRIKNDMENGIVKRAKENKDYSKVYSTEVAANKNLSERAKASYTASTDTNYAKEGGLSYDNTTGKFNDYRDAQEEIVGGIADQSKSIKSVIDSVKTDSTGQDGGYRPGIVGGENVIVNTSNSTAFVTEERLRAAGELELKDKNFLVSQEKMYENEINSGILEPELKEDGTYKTATEYAQNDYDNYLNTLVDVGMRRTGTITERASAMPKGNGSTFSPDTYLGDLIIDTTSTGKNPSSNKTITRYDKLETAFSGGKGGVKLQALGFSSSSQLIELGVTTDASKKSLETIAGALEVIDPSLVGASTRVRNIAAAEYLEHTLNKNTISSPATFINKKEGDMSKAEKKEGVLQSKKNLALLVSYPTDQQDVYATITNADGSWSQVDSTSIGGLANAMGKTGDVYYKNGVVKSTQEKVGPNGEYYHKGAVIDAMNSTKKYRNSVTGKYDSFPKGTPLPREYISDLTIDAENTYKEETFSNASIIKPTANNFKKETTWDVDPGGGIKQDVNFVYRQTLVKSNKSQVPAGQSPQMEAVTLTLYFNPDRFKN